MKSFSEVYNEYFALSEYDLAKEMYEAGQQSKQDEVDELQKRINEAIELLEYNEYVDSPLQALNILKGDQS